METLTLTSMVMTCPRKSFHRAIIESAEKRCHLFVTVLNKSSHADGRQRRAELACRPND